jgi:DNA-binding NtrC family response regulator
VPAPIEKPGKIEIDATGNETIMVVEDDHHVRKTAVKILELKGYRVVSASDGSECLKMMENMGRSIDLLMTDVIMPDMNGKELYLKIVDKFPGMKVIYMSGYTNDIIAHHGVLTEGVHFIQKPFSMADIASLVRRVLDEKK